MRAERCSCTHEECTCHELHARIQRLLIFACVSIARRAKRCSGTQCACHQLCMCATPSLIVCSLILSGISGPFGFFDPLGLTNNLTPGKVRYFREVEVKHGRVAMLGAVGFVLAESFHPLFGGDIDVPSCVEINQCVGCTR